jgi:hypothetical protein
MLWWPKIRSNATCELYTLDGKNFELQVVIVRDVWQWMSLSLRSLPKALVEALAPTSMPFLI